MTTNLLLLFLFSFLLPTLIHAQASGSGTTTRYWDCCKASCGWAGKATLAYGSNPVTSCDVSNNPLTNYNAVSYCASSAGTAYMVRIWFIGLVVFRDQLYSRICETRVSSSLDCNPTTRGFQFLKIILYFDYTQSFN